MQRPDKYASNDIPRPPLRHQHPRQRPCPASRSMVSVGCIGVARVGVVAGVDVGMWVGCVPGCHVGWLGPGSVDCSGVITARATPYCGLPPAAWSFRRPIFLAAICLATRSISVSVGISSASCCWDYLECRLAILHTQLSILLLGAFRSPVP